MDCRRSSSFAVGVGEELLVPPSREVSVNFSQMGIFHIETDHTLIHLKQACDLLLRGVYTFRPPVSSTHRSQRHQDTVNIRRPRLRR